jgi:hypothetical protein
MLRCIESLYDFRVKTIDLDTDKPIYVPQYPIPVKMRALMKETIDAFNLQNCHTVVTLSLLSASPRHYFLIHKNAPWNNFLFPSQLKLAFLIVTISTQRL